MIGSLLVDKAYDASFDKPRLGVVGVFLGGKEILLAGVPTVAGGGGVRAYPS